jgi:hypothetical protein
VSEAKKKTIRVQGTRQPEVVALIRPILTDELNRCFAEYSLKYGYRYPSYPSNQTCDNQFFSGYP